MEFPISGGHQEHVDDFINSIAPLVCNEWLRRRELGQKTISPAVVIAQAALESGWNLNASTLFGIKGEGVIANTQEYINGAYVNITDSFQKYESVTEAIVGYYDLMQWDNYDDATSANTVEDELEGLTNDIGYPYATSPTYKENCLAIINQYELRAYNEYVCSVVDVKDEKPTAVPDTIDEDVVDAIYNGDYGNGDERKERLEAAGYDYLAYQARVEEKYYSDNTEDSTPTESIELSEGMEVKFIGATDVNGTSLAYTDRTYVISGFSEDRKKVLLDIYNEHYAWVWASEVMPV